MKKFLSLILAALMMLSIGTVAYAHENVDNTFDNFTPGPGVQAPDNWYDPYSYDENGVILPCSLVYGENTALYCNKVNKMWQIGAIAIGNTRIPPYNFLLTAVIDGKEMSANVHYCPYCGEHPAPGQNTFFNNHKYLQGVIYGVYCSSCGEFSGYPNVLEYNRDFYCHHCANANNPQTEKFYRFVQEKDLNSEASHIYSNSAHLYGDGIDGKIEDLERNGVSVIIGWDRPTSNPNNPEEPAELTFWEKFVQFFVSIGDFFVKLFTWSW